MKSLTYGLKKSLSTQTKLFADLPTLRVVDNPPSTIPPNILDTSTQPNLVIIEEQCVTLIELTIPFNSQESLTNAKTRKENKENYQLVLEDLESRDYVANLITIEIGSTQSLASKNSLSPTRGISLSI